jgi:hypothetical protein
MRLRAWRASCLAHARPHRCGRACVPAQHLLPSPPPPTHTPNINQVITPLLRILEKMHSMKLLHRDIKPENIFLTALGKFRLGDFGLAIKFDRELAFSRSGTLDYMAPEVREVRGVECAVGGAAGGAAVSAASAGGGCSAWPHATLRLAGRAHTASAAQGALPRLAGSLTCGQAPAAQPTTPPRPHPHTHTHRC